jgi:hypothetical protein
MGELFFTERLVFAACVSDGLKCGINALLLEYIYGASRAREWKMCHNLIGVSRIFVYERCEPACKVMDIHGEDIDRFVLVVLSTSLEFGLDLRM